MLIEHYLVHGLGKLKVDLAKERGGIRRALSSELLSVLGHSENSVHLIVVNFGDLVSWHVLNVEIIFQKRIGLASGIKSCLESLGEGSWVLVIKENVDPMKSTLLLGVLPIALIPLRSQQVPLDLELSPEAKAILISPKTYSSNLNFLWADRRLRLCWFFTLGHYLLSSLDSDPVSRGSCVKLFVIVSFQRQPSTNSLGWVSELDLHVQEKVLDVKFREVNDLVRFSSLLYHRWELLGRRSGVLLLSLLWRWLVTMRVESGNRRGWGLLLKH